MGLWALDVFALLARKAGADVEALSLWRFDSFDRPERWEAAAAEAAAADIIIVALRQSRDVPLQVTSWIEEWTRCRKRHHGALVLLLDSRAARDAGKSEVAGRLQAVAETAGMDFFCGEPTGAWSDTTLDRSAASAPDASWDGAEEWAEDRLSLSGRGTNE